MPLEIKELVIRATIDAGGKPSGGQGGGGGKLEQHEREAIVAECVDQVMEILRRRQER